MSSNGNAYLALDLPQHALDALAAVARALAAAAAGRFDAQEVGLHVTFFFAGEALSALPARELRRFHDDAAEAARAIGAAGPQPLRFRGLALFPPTKRNLVVALFDAPGALAALSRVILTALLQLKSLQLR